MGVRSFFRLAAIAIAMLGACLAAPANAQKGIAGRTIDVCIHPAGPGDDPTTLLSQPSRFDCRSAQSEFGPGDFWARSKSLPARMDHAGGYRVRSFSVWQSGVTIYGRYRDGAIVAVPISGQQTARHIQLGGILEAALPARASPLTDLLWHIEGSGNVRGILVGARLAGTQESNAANVKMAGIYGAFGGLCFALLVYNLAMWSVLRHRFQLAYCLMLVALMVYATSSSGALAWLLPELHNTVRLKVNYAALAVSASSAILFARSFFEPRIFAGWIGKAALTICGGLLGSAALIAIFGDLQPRLADRIYCTAFLGVVAIVPPVLIRAFLRRSNYLWVFMIAWALPVIFAGIRIISSLHLIPWNFWLDNSTILSMTAEAMMSSLAITYRVRLLSQERDEARIQELAARALADLDPLTGLLNRRAFLQAAIGREGEQMLLIADIDHFKGVNDTIGHDGGDEVLRVFARALRRSVPNDALIARIGGEEFAIVARSDSAIRPEDVLDRLRAERMPFDLTVTASIGTCSGPLLNDIDWKRLYRRADRALYEAKSSGRDRVRRGVPLAA